MISVSVRMSLSYGSERIFENFQLQLEPGRLICLLGRSGSGKSTLLRFIAGLIPRQVGSGEVIANDNQPLEGRIAWMSQQDLLLPWLTVKDNVLIGSLLRNASSEELTGKARKLLEEVELHNAESRYPFELSGGMRQRVALARTLIEERPVNLLDEPFSGLDASTRFQLQALTCRLLAKRTTLLVTHDPLEAIRMADRIYVLSGRPAFLAEPVDPPGLPPRHPGDQHASAIYAQLMNQLNHPEFANHVA